MKRKKYLIAIPILFAAVFAGFSLSARGQTVGITLPSAPASVSATVNPPSQVSLSWSAAAETSGTIADYDVYRNGLHITTTAGTSLVDSGVTPGVYMYTVTASDANGNVSPQSPPASVTLIADTTPPTAPTGAIITGTTSTNSSYTPVTFTLSWTPSTDNVGVVGYYVYRNGAQIVTSTSPFNGTSLTDTVTPGTYTYAVAAYDAAQNISARSAPVTVTVGIDGIPPSVPTNVSAQQVLADGVNVAWATSTDPSLPGESASGVAGYQVYRNGTQVASAGGPPYADSGMPVGFIYVYTVKAYDVAGNVSAASTPAQVMVQQTNGPGVPNGLSAVLLGTSSAQLSWNPAVDSLPITGYTIYRDDTQIASVTSLNYVDGGLASGTYAYSVSATDTGGTVSATSSPAAVIIPAIELVSSPTATGPASMPSSSAVSSNAASETLSGLMGSGIPTFTQFLYFGLRSAQVQGLQSLFAGHGYLASANATGFFGSLTLHALQQFQCDQNIVCTGGGGWGTVGPKTRAALNALLGSTPAVSSVPSSSSSSSLVAQLQALEAELAALQKQVQ